MTGIEIFELDLKFRLRVLFLTLLFIMISMKVVYALGWEDKKWVEAGCPSNVFGTWISGDSEVISEKLLTIYQDRIRFLDNHAFEKKYSFKRKDMVEGKQFVEIKLQPVSKEKSIYLKIRPHLVLSGSDIKKKNKNTQNCFVKVFKFDSQKNSKYDKYLNWEIYKLKK